ncbi:response regulator transcription factor [Luteolibacter marinus]|uniref:response regulator transcription factor n=1 Tax=Luteolibacter marinus TaxID=2776705 RepID=UPI001D0280C2|nr:response regulator transcription factor [Luteolibacter marinus]
MTRIGIVEDNRTTREGLETIINLSQDFRCVCAYDTAEEALENLPEHSPEVVLMDIQLPGISGIECVARLKKLMPEVQVIMVTVYEDPDRIFSALRNGASGYLLKRSAPDQVLAAIRDVQNGGAPMSGEIARKVILHFREQSTTAAEVEKLTAREREVLELVAHGFINKEIADRLSVTVEAIRWHLKNIYAKLHVHSRTEAALKFRGPG